MTEYLATPFTGPEIVLLAALLATLVFGAR